MQNSCAIDAFRYSITLLSPQGLSLVHWYRGISLMSFELKIDIDPSLRASVGGRTNLLVRLRFTEQARGRVAYFACLVHRAQPGGPARKPSCL